MKKLLLTGFALVSMFSQAQSWVAQGTKFPTNFGVDEIKIVDANTVWAFAYDGSGAGTYPKIVTRTTNGGATWATANITGPGSNALISDIAAVDANTAWVITAPYTSGSNANRIWKTTNGGSTWTQQTSVGFTSASFGNQIYFWDANNGWACGDPVADGKFEMYKTSNGGTTWTAVAGRPVAQGEYSYVGLKEVVGDNIWFGTDLGNILHSTDRGESWVSYPSPVIDFGGVTTSGASGVMSFKDANNGLLVAVSGTSAELYKTTNGGQDWEPIQPTGTWFYGDMTYVPGTENTYVSTGISSAAAQGVGSAYSKDGGLTWTIIDNIAANEGGQRGKVQFLNPTTGWAGYFSDGTAGVEGILKFSGDLSLGVSDNAVKSSLKVSPNPAVDVVKISSNKKIENVTVFDMTGKKVQTFKGANEINVSSLAKGTYILQVYYGGGAVENTKLIKK